jgi:hypothetical protein
MWSHDWDLNPRPPPYHGGALPLSYRGLISVKLYQITAVSPSTLDQVIIRQQLFATSDR